MAFVVYFYTFYFYFLFREALNIFDGINRIFRDDMIRYDRQLYVDFNKTHIKYVFNGTKLDIIALKTRVYIHCQKLNKLGWGKIMCEREHLQWKCYHKGLCEVVREVWLNSQVWDVWKKFAHLYFSRIGMRAHFYCMFAVLSWKFWSFRNKLHAF